MAEPDRKMSRPFPLSSNKDYVPRGDKKPFKFLVKGFVGRSIYDVI